MELFKYWKRPMIPQSLFFFVLCNIKMCTVNASKLIQLQEFKTKDYF